MPTASAQVAYNLIARAVAFSKSVALSVGLIIVLIVGGLNVTMKSGLTATEMTTGTIGTTAVKERHITLNGLLQLGTVHNKFFKKGSEVSSYWKLH